MAQSKITCTKNTFFIIYFLKNEKFIKLLIMHCQPVNWNWNLFFEVFSLPRIFIHRSFQILLLKWFTLIAAYRNEMIHSLLVINRKSGLTCDAYFYHDNEWQTLSHKGLVRHIGERGLLGRRWCQNASWKARGGIFFFFILLY